MRRYYRSVIPHESDLPFLGWVGVQHELTQRFHNLSDGLIVLGQGSFQRIRSLGL